jgi:hypothetical protein
MTYSRGVALPIQHLHLTLRLDMRHLQIACSSGLVFGSRAAIIASDRQARTRRHLWKRDAMKWWSCCASKWEGGQWWNDAWRKTRVTELRSEIWHYLSSADVVFECTLDLIQSITKVCDSTTLATDDDAMIEVVAAWWQSCWWIGGWCSHGSPLALMYVLRRNKITRVKQGDIYVYIVVPLQ